MNTECQVYAVPSQMARLFLALTPLDYKLGISSPLLNLLLTPIEKTLWRCSVTHFPSAEL